MLSADLLAQRQSRSPFTAQRQARAAGVDPRHARILQLQRDAGNKAVSRMLQDQRKPVIQRELSYRAGDLRPHMRALTGTYAKLVRVLLDYHRTSDTSTKVAGAAAIVGLSDTWLKDHATPKPGKKGTLKREDAQRSLITRLRAEARREHQKLQSDAAYLARLQGGGFKAMSPTTRLNAEKPSHELSRGRALAKPYEGADKAALEVIRKYKLTEAEIAAIRIYTVSDYAYINPAMVGSESWMKESIVGSKDDIFKAKFLPPQYKPGDPWSKPGLAQLQEEGKAHAAKVMEAVVKLDPYGQTAYRGARLKPGEFETKYAKGAEVPFGAFGSSSKNQDIARKYADGSGGDVFAPDDATVSVLLIMEMKNGRDISKISASMKPEDEVLILPGSTFVVDRRQAFTKGNEGKPKATQWFTVYLRQVR